MSLYIGDKEIENYEEKCRIETPDGERFRFMVVLLGHFAMAIGMSKITEKNYKEFFERLCILAAMNGPALKCGNGQDYCISLEDVREHIGLGTNVGDETRKQFDARMKKFLYRDVLRKAEKIRKENQESQFPQWKVESRGDFWYIVHPSKRAKRIGRVKATGVNYYDKAKEEASRRNREEEASWSAH